MRAHAIAGLRLRRRVRTTVPEPADQTVPDLLGRDFTAPAPNSAIATVPSESVQSRSGSVGLGFAIAADVALPIARVADRHRVIHDTVDVSAQAVPLVQTPPASAGRSATLHGSSGG
jgi:hypothetical protein